MQLDEFVAEGDTVFLPPTMTGTHDGEYKGVAATGRHISFESAGSSDRGRAFVGYWCLTDVAGVMRQLTRRASRPLSQPSPESSRRGPSNRPAPFRSWPHRALLPAGVLSSMRGRVQIAVMTRDP